MIRTNFTARRARAVLVAALAAAALTACGSEPAHQGTAAIVGEDRITIAAVNARVAEVRAAMTTPGGVSQPERAGLVRHTIDQLVLDRLVDQALTDRQLQVTGEEVAEAKGENAKLLGGEDRLDQALAAQLGIPASDSDAFYRQVVGVRKLAAADGQDASTPAGRAAVLRSLAEAGTKLKIEINPRYGQWDVQQAGVIDRVEDWLPRNGTVS